MAHYSPVHDEELELERVILTRCMYLFPFYLARLSSILHIKYCTSAPTRSPPTEKPRVSNALLSRSNLVGPRTQMALFFLVGIVAMGAHHGLNAYLDRKPIEDSPISPFRTSLSKTLREQSLVNALGNILSTLGKIGLAGATGVAFDQLFWRRMRTAGLTVQEVDNTLDFKGNPAKFTTWTSGLHAFWLYIVATAASLLVIITIVTPGSITVTSMLTARSCTVKTVNLGGANLAANQALSSLDGVAGGFKYNQPTDDLRFSIARTMMSGTYSVPSTPCGVCEYNISFIAPALQCQDLTSQTDISSVMPQFPFGSYFYVWNATSNYTITESDDIGPRKELLHLPVASRDMPNVVIDSADTFQFNFSQYPTNWQALNCVAHNATYKVRVNHNFTAAMTVLSTEMGPELPLIMRSRTTSDFQAQAIWEALVGHLNGTITYSKTKNTLDLVDSPQLSVLQYSSFVFSSSTTLPWKWSMNLSDALPSLMQNISLSLLSDHSPNNSTIADLDTDCQVAALHYTYSPLRLLLTYAAGAALTAICVVFGFMATLANGVGESMAFSRLLGGSFDFKDRMVDAGVDGLSPDTKIDCDASGRLQSSTMSR